MGCWTKDIDEYTMLALIYEIYIRKARQAEGLCDYCNRPYNTPPCKFPDRHKPQEKSEEKK